MAKAIPNPEPFRNRPGGLPRFGKRPGDKPSSQGEAGPRGAWGEEDPLARELEGADDNGSAQEVGRLQAENAELQNLNTELRQLLEEAAAKNETGWEERQKEYETLLDEKSELIRQLHAENQELKERPVTPQTPKEEELLALSEELEKERCQLQQDRRLLDEERREVAEDEQTMTRQMRDMEVQMARERADLARQRAELQRIHEEIRRELENIERNGLLNQRLSQLRQRYQEVTSRKGSSLGLEPLPPLEPAPPPVVEGETQPVGEPPMPKKKDSGLVRRLFGKGNK